MNALVTSLQLHALIADIASACAGGRAEYWLSKKVGANTSMVLLERYTDPHLISGAHHESY